MQSVNYPTSNAYASAGNTYASSSTKPSKQEIIAQLKAKAEQRKQAQGKEEASSTLLAIENATSSVEAKISAPPDPLKKATFGSNFMSALRSSQNEQPQSVALKPFATIADPLVLAEADIAPNHALVELEMHKVPQMNPADRNRYEQFKNVCESKNIPAGMMQLLWKHLENDLTIIDVDTSLSMNNVDKPQAHAPQAHVEIVCLGENEVNPATHFGRPLPRMEEAKQRLKDILPILFTGNQRGIVHLKSLSDPQGRHWDMSRVPHKQALQEANAYVQNLRADLNHTPSVSNYFKSCLEAHHMMRAQPRVQSSTIVSFSDGEPNQHTDTDVEHLYQSYRNQVLMRRGDYQRADGSIVPHHVAATWNMDSDTPELMRRLSVLAGHFNIPTTIAACTNDDYAMGEQNELDELHTNVAVIDDFHSEQREVIRNQGIRFPFNKAMYLALNFIAPKITAFDNIDEKPLTPDELETILGYYPGYDAYMQNLDTSVTAIEATKEKTIPSQPSYGYPR